MHVTPKNIDDDLFKFTVDPGSLFKEIIFDPRMNYVEFKKWKEKIKGLGYKGRIVKSNLYKIPDLKINLHKPE